MPRRKQNWSELSPRARALVVVGGVVQVGLTVAALVDLQRRPAEQLNGSKRLWTAVSFINFAGPLAYFARGRRR